MRVLFEGQHYEVEADTARGYAFVQEATRPGDECRWHLPTGGRIFILQSDELSGAFRGFRNVDGILYLWDQVA